MLSRRFLATSPHPVAQAARRAARAVSSFSLPAPKVVFGPTLNAFLAAREVYYFGARVLVCEPLFKAMCKEHGRNVHTGSHLHYITGKGDIIVGDDVLMDGKISIAFGARYTDRPVLRIGDKTGIGHDSSFRIAKQVTIGAHCRIAPRVSIMDLNGHPAEAEARRAGLFSDPSEIKPVTIEDNVWVGRGAMIMPGVTVGEGSIVAAGAVVLANVPAYSVVAGNPARKIGVVPRASAGSATRDPTRNPMTDATAEPVSEAK